MFKNIVELKRIGEEKLSGLNETITDIEEQVGLADWGDKARSRRQKIIYLNELYGEQGKLKNFLEVLAEIRNA